jgi:hypothetical protein
MSELVSPFGARPGAIEQRADADKSPRAPGLVTEQQVLFATSAAAPLQPAKTSRRWTLAARAIGASLWPAFVTPGNAQPKRRHHPSHNDFIEDSCMAREMWRL